MVTSHNAVHIGRNLSRLRNARSLTQQALADLCADLDPDPITVRMISRWELGESDIPASRLSVLAAALEVTADRICGCIPSDGITDPAVISDAITRLSPDRRQEIDYIFRRWDGPVSTLITLMCAYASMPGSYRADCAFVVQHQFQKAVADGSIDPCAPLADIDSICAAWERIVTSRNIK